MTYVTRSNFMQSTSFSYYIQGGDEDLAARVKTAMEEHRAYSPYFLCDYYPLTAFSDRAEDWMAWQYHDADDNSGIVQVFKREGSADSAGKYYLSGLEKGATLYCEGHRHGRELRGEGPRPDGGRHGRGRYRTRLWRRYSITRQNNNRLQKDGARRRPFAFTAAPEQPGLR